jgi:hypothetical protein
LVNAFGVSGVDATEYFCSPSPSREFIETEVHKLPNPRDGAMITDALLLMVVAVRGRGEFVRIDVIENLHC